MKNRDVTPFEPTLDAAINDARDNQDAVRAAHTERTEWFVARHAKYASGESTVSVLRPDGLRVVDLEISIDDVPQPYSGGPGVVAALLLVPADHVTISADGIPLLVSITNL